ncbi:MAG: class I SAM-dependent methyltransferase, partial [Magnetococcus sp. DMHC-8]
MMLEAVKLHNWYDSPRGQTVASLVGDVMVQWLSVNHPDIRILGLGFAQPYLDKIVCSMPKERCGRPLGASPAEMGVVAWPRGEPNRVAQVRPDALPFADEQFNQVIMAHFLEGCESSQAALRETWRILMPGGRLLIMVPNRGGWWARRDSTPFGWGRPYSPRQLMTLLTESLFIPRQSRFALFMPPVAERTFPRAAPAWEKAGSRW